MQKASKEPILEEAELDFKPLEEREEGLEEERQLKETKETGTEVKNDRKGQTLDFCYIANKCGTKVTCWVFLSHVANLF